ncbi:hypothetical protein VaNZ11_012652 [Volvox africanus]|uniref:Protein SirB1 N-terminal domain-containing protein n=1 Tax=Volvox africanus TaxID=51714 RepID=A0ABQ5SF62_9CHLO|nr:hypothetical protein VaNZ11_012652 [Volvox africanus]
MPQVSVKLYRLLHRVRKDYSKAQIPFVGIIGFQIPPVLDPQSQLANAFRSTAATNAGINGRQDSDGFRALRQAQQQLEILKNTEEVTREALQGWFQLCESWAGRLHGSRDAAYTVVSHDDDKDVCAIGTAQGDMHRGGGHDRVDGIRTMEPDLKQLAAALEEGALLVDRLYDSNHLSLEEFDTEGDLREGEESVTDLSRDGADEVTVSGSGGVGDDLPFVLLRVPSVLAVRRQLDDLAAAVVTSHPGLFPYSSIHRRVGSDSYSGGNGTDSGSGGAREGGDLGARGGGRSQPIFLRQQLEAISKVLFHQLKFRHEPVEWVYDGLAPALLPQVVKRRRGIPLSLAILYCCVARRLGVPAAPVKAAAGGMPGISEGPAALHNLPPEVAARQAGRTVALAPSLDAWLVAAAPPQRQPSPGIASEPGRGGAVRSCPGAQAEAGQVIADAAGPGATTVATGFDIEEAGSVITGLVTHWSGIGKLVTADGPQLGLQLFVDVDKRGRVLDPEEARGRYTDLQVLVSSPLELWCELARVMVIAHGRRGESDLVAHWLVQVLALDHRSAEWAAMTAR